MRNSASFSGTILSILAPGLVAVALCGGCSTIMQGEGPAQTESMLVTAGFKMNLADTPAELSLIEAKPQRKVTPIKRGDKLYFGYADAKGCKCSYLGDEAAYQKYETLLVDNRMVEESRSEPDIIEPANVVIVTDDDEWEAWGGIVIGEKPRCPPTATSSTESTTTTRSSSSTPSTTSSRWPMTAPESRRPW